MPHIAAFGQAAFGKDVLSNYLKQNLKGNLINLDLLIIWSTIHL